MDSIAIGSLAVWVHPPVEGEVRARVLLVHGIGEHSGRHLNTINYLTNRGISVIRFDLRGSGHSGGRRQWIERFEDYVDDTNSVFNWVCSKLEAAPLFVLGHSLGGAIGIYLAASRSKELAGLVLSAPAYRVGEEISSLKILVGKLVTPILPHLRLPNTNHHAVSRDKSVVQDFVEDPLACHFNTLRQGAEVLEALKKIPEKVQQIECPVLIVHGSADRIIQLQGSYDILRQLAVTDKSLQVLPDGYHEPHNDLDKKNYFNSLEQWIGRRIAHPLT